MSKQLIILLLLGCIAYCYAAVPPNVNNYGLTTDAKEIAANLRSCDVPLALKRWNDNQHRHLNVALGDSIVEIIKSAYSAQPKIFDCIVKFIFSLVDIQLQGLAAKQMFIEMVDSNGVAGSKIFPFAYQIKNSIVAHNISSVGNNESSVLENHQWVLDRLPGPVKKITLADSFKFRNGHRGGYIYASDYRHKDDARRYVLRWNPGNSVTHSDWEVRTTSAGDYYLYNTGRGEYLYAAGSDYVYDDDRRSVFCWVPGGPVSQGHWIFSLNSDMQTIKIGTVLSYIIIGDVTEYLYADSLNFNNNDRGYIFTKIGGGLPLFGFGADWYVE